MKKQTIISCIMAAAVIMSSLVSCTKSEADEGNIFDFTNKKTVERALADAAQVKLADKKSNAVTLDEVKELVDEAVRICGSYEAVKISDERTLVCEDVSYIDLDYVKTLNPENYEEEYDKFIAYEHNVYDTFLKLLESRLPENAVWHADIEEWAMINTNVPEAYYVLNIDETGYESINELIDWMWIREDDVSCEYIVVLCGQIIYKNTVTGAEVELCPIPEFLEISNAFYEIYETANSREYIEEQVYKLHGVIVDLEE